MRLIVVVPDKRSDQGEKSQGSTSAKRTRCTAFARQACGPQSRKVVVRLKILPDQLRGPSPPASDPRPHGRSNRRRAARPSGRRPVAPVCLSNVPLGGPSMTAHRGTDHCPSAGRVSLRFNRHEALHTLSVVVAQSGNLRYGHLPQPCLLSNQACLTLTS